MAVVVETTLGDITIDLYTKDRPRACLNFLKLCKMKYYNYSLFHTVSRDFIAQTGDPTGSRKGGESIFGVLEGPLKRYFEAETHPRIKHTITGLVSFVGAENNMIGSQFFITLAPDLTYLDDHHCVFGEVAEGLDVLELLNDAICDNDNRPYQDIRITHTVVLDDPYPDLPKLRVPSRSPSPSAERLQGGRIAPDEEIDETTGKDLQEIEEIKADREAKARATILEMVGDIPDAEMAPPENVLFVCKLNPVTTDDDLEIIFSRFGKINSCEVIRDRKTGDSLQYAFIEFDDKKACEDAYFKMDNVLIDDRRIHVDFSQSVAKVKWLGKGRGVAHFDDKGRRTDDKKNDIGRGNYRSTKKQNREGDTKRPAAGAKPSKDRNRERSPHNKEKAPRYRERSPRDRQRSSKEGQGSPRHKETSGKYKSPMRSSDRSGRYQEERDKARHRPYAPPEKEAECSYKFDDRRKDSYYSSRSHEQSRRRNRDRSSSQEAEHRRQSQKRDKPKEELRKYWKSNISLEFFSSEEERTERTSKPKPSRAKKSNKSSSSSPSRDVESANRKKTKRQKKALGSESENDSSDDSYKKKKKTKKKKRRKHEDSSD